MCIYLHWKKCAWQKYLFLCTTLSNNLLFVYLLHPFLCLTKILLCLGFPLAQSYHRYNNASSTTVTKAAIKHQWSSITSLTVHPPKLHGRMVNVGKGLITTVYMAKQQHLSPFPLSDCQICSPTTAILSSRSVWWVY